MSRKEFYSQAAHTVVVDEYLDLEDFAEGEEVISFEPQGEAVSNRRGLDRNTTDFGSPRPGWLTVQLKDTSPSIDLLDEIIRNAENGNPRQVSVVVRTGVNDRLNLINAGIEDASFGTGGVVGSTRTYIFKAANYEKPPVG